jgi:hypothetical protein
MKKRVILSFLGIVVLCFTSGCATMFSGSTQPVTFNSDPDGVSVTVAGQALGKTPTTIVLERKSDLVVDFVKEGYTKQTIKMNTRFNPWVLANVIFCLSCVLSTTTDYATGAAYEYSPNNYFITMVPEGVTETPIDIKKREVKSFIIGNYGSIVTELNRDSGGPVGPGGGHRGPEEFSSSEYTKTLFTMLEIPEADREGARDKIKDISDGTKDALIFADQVIKAFIEE